MGEEYSAKVFRSGNSVALRLPKALGFSDGDEVAVIPQADGSLSVRPKGDAKRMFMSLYGAFSPGFMADGRGEIDQEDRDWGRPLDDQAARQ